jgi:hypothetical protein
MSSSISSSDADAGWARWLAAFAATLALAAAMVFAAVIAIDPYDSGRFGSGIAGTSDTNPNLANASHARDPRFNATIIGDSTGQALDPAALSSLTGLRFVQLTVPGTGPREQLAILDFFTRQHSQIAAVVIAVDPVWCTRDAALPPPHLFPFWLYEADRFEYALRLFSLRALGRAWRRVQIALGRRTPTRADGYVTHSTTITHAFQPGPANIDTTPDATGTPSEDFPAAARLAQALKTIPDVAVVLVAPPFFHTHVPRPGSQADAEDRACKRALQRIVETHKRGRFVDLRADSALTHDPANFKDNFHVSASGARLVERTIAAAINAR